VSFLGSFHRPPLYRYRPSRSTCFSHAVRHPHLMTLIIVHATFLRGQLYNNVNARLRRTVRVHDEASAGSRSGSMAAFGT